MLQDFWHHTTLGVIGGGSWGTVLAQLVAQNCKKVRIWMRSENAAKTLNQTHRNMHYLPNFVLHDNIEAVHTFPDFFKGGLSALIWALPSNVCREQACQIAPYLRGDEFILHATKGIESKTMKRISEILQEELPCFRIGVISGPNLAAEIARGAPAATVIASHFEEICDAGQILLANPRFRIYRSNDVIGVEWAGTLKNILAIAAGALDAMQLGWNARAMLITRGLAEMVRFSVAMGAQESMFLGLAGVGDLLATCSSPLSRNYRVGYRLAQGEDLQKILADLDSVAEGVRTTNSIWEFAAAQNISMPITEGVYRLLNGKISAQDILHELMTRPSQFGSLNPSSKISLRPGMSGQ